MSRVEYHATTLRKEAEKVTERHMLDLLHQRYTARSQAGERYVRAEHVRSCAGFDAKRTCDFMAMDMWESAGNALHGHEVKVSRSDWLRELRDPSKAAEFTSICDFWWIVAPDGVVKSDELPEHWGLLCPTPAGVLRARRKATGLRPFGEVRSRYARYQSWPAYPDLPRSFTAALLRSAVKTNGKVVAGD